MAIVYAKCTHCGMLLQVESTLDAAVCPNCKAAFIVEKAIQNYNEHQGESPMVAQAVLPNQPTNEPNKNGTKKKVIIAVTIILLVILLGVGGYFLYNALSDDDDDDSGSRRKNKNDSSYTGDNDPDDDYKDPINIGDIDDDDDDTKYSSQDRTSSSYPSNALEGTYVSESGLYTIEFYDDFTCVWYQRMYGNNIYFDGTYKKSGNKYVLHIDGETYSYNTKFDAVPSEGGLIVTGGVVNGELFIKQ